MKEGRLIGRIYKKGWMVDVCGSSNSDEFKASHISIVNVNEKESSLEEFEQVACAIRIMLDLDNPKSTATKIYETRVAPEKN